MTQYRPRLVALLSLVLAATAGCKKPGGEGTEGSGPGSGGGGSPRAEVVISSETPPVPLAPGASDAQALTDHAREVAAQAQAALDEKARGMEE